MNILFQSALGYLLVGLNQHKNQKYSLKAFFPFDNNKIAIQNMNLIIKGKISPQLQQFLSSISQSNLPLGVADNKLASSLIDQGYTVQTGTKVVQACREIRGSLLKILNSQEITQKDLLKCQLGLSHGFSREKISQDTNREDKPIIQSINLLDLLDKDLNTLTMRVREWYSWHFPQLIKIVSDNYTYVKLIQIIGDKNNTLCKKQDVQAIVGQDITENIYDAMGVSIGQQLSQFDTQCILQLCSKIINLFEYREELQKYLKEKMEMVAPNLTNIIGQNLGAKLIAHSGSLSSLSKFPASTIQILGAEKALFRALKSKGKCNTPKYGMLYHSSFIGRAIGKNKGKISRFLANKCSMAAKLDNFLIAVFLNNQPTNKFGERLKMQVENRLNLLTKGGEPEDNQEVMNQLMEELKEQNLYFENQQEYISESKKKLKKKKKSIQIQEEQDQLEERKRKKKRLL